MPIYEFYCSDCHAVFNFFARTQNTAARPKCPRCGQPDLERWMSRVAISKGRKEEGPGDAGGPDLDEAKMERVMEELAGEAGGIDEDDPRQMARLMRRLADSGLPLGETMEEAVRRLEAGESPEEIEEELGDLLEADDTLFGQADSQGGRGRRSRPPEVDETLYDL